VIFMLAAFVCAARFTRLGLAYLGLA